MTGKKSLITLCQFTFYVTMVYELVNMFFAGEMFDALIISRSLLHLCMVYFIGRFAKIIIDKWMQVMNRSQDEIEQLTEATIHLNDFLANVSHELRTPVNAIIRPYVRVSDMDWDGDNLLYSEKDVRFMERHSSRSDNIRSVRESCERFKWSFSATR